MGEIDRSSRVDDEYEAESDQCVGRTKRDAVNRKLQKSHRRRAP
jgi:hypothetical protein